MSFRVAAAAPPALNPPSADLPGPSPGPWGASPPGAPATLHVLGGGKVGRSFLRSLPETEYRLVAVSDRSGTIFASPGLDPKLYADLKEDGAVIGDLPGAAAVPIRVQLALHPLDVVVDCTDSETRQAASALSRSLDVLGAGSALVLAAKNGLANGCQELLDAAPPGRLGINAVLGGTGLAFLDELEELRQNCDAIECVLNVTTTAIIEVIERGGELEDGIAQARALGFLEGDPRQDLSGSDAASKLIIIAAALFGTVAGPADVATADVGDLAPELLRRRYRDGATTRLVARGTPCGDLGVRYEEVRRGATLAVPSGRVAYCYSLGNGTRRVHVGAGVGLAGTAAALLADVRRVVAAAEAGP